MQFDAMAQQDDTPFEQSTNVLLERAQAGDDGARERLITRHLIRLQRWARGRLPASARGALDTDDLVQQTLVGTIKNMESFEPFHTGGFQAYLRRGIQNGIVDALRAAGRKPAASDDVEGEPADAPSPLEQAIGRQTLERYERALSRLKPAERETVIARVELGLSFKEIATELGKPSPDAVRMAVNRSLLRLAQEMRRHDE